MQKTPPFQRPQLGMQVVATMCVKWAKEWRKHCFFSCSLTYNPRIYLPQPDLWNFHSQHLSSCIPCSPSVYFPPSISMWFFCSLSIFLDLSSFWISLGDTGHKIHILLKKICDHFSFKLSHSTFMIHEFISILGSYIFIINNVFSNSYIWN